METSENIIESEQVRVGEALDDAKQLDQMPGETHTSHSVVVSHNGNEDPYRHSPPKEVHHHYQQQHHHHPHQIDHLLHNEEESIGSGGVTSLDSNESSTNHMDDSLGPTMTTTTSVAEQHLSRDEKPPANSMDQEDNLEEAAEDHDDLEDDEEEDDEMGEEAAEAEQEEEGEGNAVVAEKPAKEKTKTTATAKKEPATKRFKCLHCSKSYVREFQLNTHVRKYHPEKPVKPQDNSAAAAATTTPAWTQTDMEDALEALKTEKMSLVKASQQYGIPASTLWQRATRLGIMIPKNVARTSSKDGVADAVQLLKTGQISVNKASKVFGIPPSTLYKIAKREGIQLSSPFNSATTSWTQENLQLAMEAIRTGQMSVHMASVEFKIPPGTLYGRCKREGLELSRNNPVTWSPRDLKNALEAVKTGQMSINQASEHYKISYSSLYKRVKPHFGTASNNNNNSSNSNQNLPKMGNELGETDLQGGVGVGGVGLGMDVVPMHHPMDYEAHRALPPHARQQQVIASHVQQQPSPVNHHQMQMQYGNSGGLAQQQQQSPIQHPHHLPSHYGQQLIQSQHPNAATTMHHYPHQQLQQQHHHQPQHPLPVHRLHHPQHQQGHLTVEENVHLHSHPLQHHSHMMHLAVNNGAHMQDERYPGHDVDKHGLTSSSGIGLNGLMGISMGFLDFAPELPAPVAVPVTEHYSSQVPTTHHQSLPYSSVITKDNSGAAPRHPQQQQNSINSTNNGHYNGDNAATALSVSGQTTVPVSVVHQSNPNSNGSSSSSSNSSSNNNANNGYATLQNNYYHHNSVIHSPVQQQQQQNHPNYGHQQQTQQQQQQHHQPPQQQHLQMHSSQQQHHHHQLHHHQQQQMHLHNQHQHQPHHQRHGMVPLNEDKLLLQKEGMVAGPSLIDSHAATAADFDEKVIVTTINDL